MTIPNSLTLSFYVLVSIPVDSYDHAFLLTAEFKPQRKSSAKMTKARFGVAMTRSKAKGIVNAITQAAIDQKNPNKMVNISELSKFPA